MRSFSGLKLISVFSLLLIVVILTVLGLTRIAAYAATTLPKLTTGSKVASVAPTVACGAWSIDSRLNPGAANYISAVAAISAHNVWAVGNGTNNPALVEHWNGSSLSISYLTPFGSASSGFTQVVAVSAHDIWAAGVYLDKNNTRHLMFEHWNGTSWSAFPDASTGLSSIYRMAAISTSDVWAVGRSSNKSTQTLIEHWNGTSWSIVPSPSPGKYFNSLDGVTAISANDVWAVGTYNVNPYRTLIEHWNGKSWSIVSTPKTGVSGLDAVVGVSTTNVWAVGASTNPTTQTLIEHWDGTSWSVVPSPNHGSGYNDLTGVSAVSANNVWAVGGYTNNSGVELTLIIHWDGTSWSVVPSPNVGTNTNVLGAVVRVPHTQQMWAVGFYFNNNSAQPQPLIESYC